MVIFRQVVVSKWASPNGKLATYGLDDPLVESVACHFSVPQKGGFKVGSGSPKNSIASVPIMS